MVAQLHVKVCDGQSRGLWIGILLYSLSLYTCSWYVKGIVEKVGVRLLPATCQLTFVSITTITKQYPKPTPPSFPGSARH